jgi:hypothetical protein
MDQVKRASKSRQPMRAQPGQAQWAVESAKLKILLEAVWRMSCARASGDKRLRVPAEQFDGDLRSLAEIVNDMAGQETC